MDNISGYDRWLRTQSFSQNTIHQRVRFADRLWHRWQTWERSPDELADYLDQYQGWTRATYFGHLCSIYDWLVEAGAVAESPMKDVRTRPRPRPRPRPLSKTELQLVFDTPMEDRTKAFLLLAFLAGLRSHEVAKVHGRDVDQDSIYVLGKGGQGATVPTHPTLWALAQQYPRNGYWFPSPQRHRLHLSTVTVSQVVADHFRGCGIAYGSIHRLRASYGTRLLENGESLPVIQELLRHLSLSSTAHYLGVSDVRKRDAIHRLVA